LLQPETHNIEHGSANGGIAPVEIRLLLENRRS
jgi:hypothetical protein